MPYNEVTLGTEDVEWLDEFSDVRDAIWDDDLFASWINEVGLKSALEAISGFWRMIANQLIERGVTQSNLNDWARRTIYLAKVAKRRRSAVRAMYREQAGDLAFFSYLRELDIKYPRAEWASKKERS